MVILGADPGKAGGFCLLNEGKVEALIQVPVVGKEIDFIALKESLEVHKEKIHFIFLERVMGIAGTSRGATFEFGRSYQTFMNVLLLLGKPLNMVSAVEWQKSVFMGEPALWRVKNGKNVRDTKGMALMVSKRLFPGVDFTPTKAAKKAHDGLVDASLIAYYGFLKTRGK